MLNTLPPGVMSPPLSGYNASPINRQAVQGMGAPGMQSHPPITALAGASTTGFNPLLAALQGGGAHSLSTGPMMGAPPMGGMLAHTAPNGILGHFPPGFAMPGNNYRGI